MKICKHCKLEKPLEEFYYHPKIMRHGVTCKVCTYDKRRKARKGIAPEKDGKDSINKYETLNNWFMTEKEIKSMYNTLKSHMWVKYGRYDEDVIQRTIIQGMAWADKYDPKRASKVVWFQTILRGIWWHHVDPKLNRRIRHHYSLDWEGDDDEENMNVLKEASSMSEEIDPFAGDLFEFITEKMNSGEYPILKLKTESIKVPDIQVQLSLTYLQYKTKLTDEIDRFTAALEAAEWEGLASWRRKFYIKNYIARVANTTGICINCGEEFNKFNTFGYFRGSAKLCSEQCKTERKTKLWRERKSKDNN